MHDQDAIFSQAPHKLKLDWGWHGCAAAGARGDIIVIVDVLRFSTACAAAAAREISIIPAGMDEELEPLARQHAAQLPQAGFSRLSPGSYAQLAAGTRMVVKSPNGATCARLSNGAAHVLLGALVNSSTVAQRVSELMSNSDLSTTIIACGERWTDENADGRLRFALEDYLGAGAILSNLDLDKSAEAIVCDNAFNASGNQLQELLLDCASGRELVARGLRADVEFAAKWDRLDVAPEVIGNVIHSPPR
jgi:2-phosphosulfolactate phosphatase